MNHQTKFVFALIALLGLTACSTPQVARGVNDPYEAQNRKIHSFNKSIDRNVLRPLAVGYGEVVPEPVRQGVGNVADNLATPGYFVNDMLQGNIEHAGSNFVRFLVNTSFGFGGLLDVATDMGIPQREADFGETLYVWGVAEGAYLETPVLGPTTERRRVGRLVDFFTNPLRYAVSDPESYALPASGALSGLNARYQFRDLVDNVLYDSADSYAQTRLLYLERRRFELSGGAAPDDGDIDPYDDSFGIDPYAE